MNQPKLTYQYFTVLLIALFLLSCNGDEVKQKDVVSDPRQMDKTVVQNIRSFLKVALADNGKMDDSSYLLMAGVVNDFYRQHDYQPTWSSSGEWLSLADSLYPFIETAELQGLFPEDYHYSKIKKLKNILDHDSLARTDALLWTKADLLFTDGVMRIIKDLKIGRLGSDSVSLNKDSVIKAAFYGATLENILNKKKLTPLLDALQPEHKGYWELKKGIRPFLDSMDRRLFTHVRYPFKRGDEKDSVAFIRLLQKRLSESDCIDIIDKLPDSVQLAAAIKKYQAIKGLKTDGRYGRILISTLNNNDVERFKRIAITLDRYKQLPEKMPEKYIWVNIPGYYMWVMQDDSLVFESKVICGKPETRTPLLSAEISDMVIYPTWTVPNSIIVKQYLPRLKKNPNYITKIGLHLVNSKGETVDPGTVNWDKYSRGIPYKVMQGSGDNNSLGVIKFNFDNPYFVYLHDTNQRYLFKNSSRALSHGCVRVQEWQKLAHYIANNDSMLLTQKREQVKYTADSINNWIAQKERRRLDVKNHIPLFIRYFSCEGKSGRIKFYEDIYGEDKLLMERYFAKK